MKRVDEFIQLDVGTRLRYEKAMSHADDVLLCNRRLIKIASVPNTYENRDENICVEYLRERKHFKILTQSKDNQKLNCEINLSAVQDYNKIKQAKLHYKNAMRIHAWRNIQEQEKIRKKNKELNRLYWLERNK